MAGFGDLGFMQRGRRLAVGSVMLLLGGVIGYVIPKSDASPRVETGTIKSVSNATQNAGILFSIKVPNTAGTEQFRWQEATPWRDKNGRWHHNGTPACLVPGSTSPLKVTIGAIDAQEASSAPGRTIVTWVKCYG